MTAFNPRKPNVARIYDALRDGKDNFGPDREAADAIRTMAADGQRAAHDNRAFLARAVRFLIKEQGIFQFLDIHDQAGTPICLRTKDEITAFFDGLEIAVPGVAEINAWKNPAYRPARTIGYGGTARGTA